MIYSLGLPNLRPTSHWLVDERRLFGPSSECIALRIRQGASRSDSHGECPTVFINGVNHDAVAAAIETTGLAVAGPDCSFDIGLGVDCLDLGRWFKRQLGR